MARLCKIRLANRGDFPCLIKRLASCEHLWSIDPPGHASRGQRVGVVYIEKTHRFGDSLGYGNQLWSGPHSSIFLPTGRDTVRTTLRGRRRYLASDSAVSTLEKSYSPVPLFFRRLSRNLRFCRLQDSPRDASFSGNVTYFSCIVNRSAEAGSGLENVRALEPLGLSAPAPGSPKCATLFCFYRN